MTFIQIILVTLIVAAFVWAFCFGFALMMTRDLKESAIVSSQLIGGALALFILGMLALYAIYLVTT